MGEAIAPRIERVLLMCAPSFQGGHSLIGGELADILGVPFPINMSELRTRALALGYLPYDLWPWLESMEAGRGAATDREGGR